MGANVSYTYMHINHVEELKPGDTYEAFVRRVEAKYRAEPEAPGAVVSELVHGITLVEEPPIETVDDATVKPEAPAIEAAVAEAGKTAEGPTASEAPASSTDPARRRRGRPRKT